MQYNADYNELYHYGVKGMKWGKNVMAGKNVHAVPGVETTRGGRNGVATNARLTGSTRTTIPSRLTSSRPTSAAGHNRAEANSPSGYSGSIATAKAASRARPANTAGYNRAEANSPSYSGTRISTAKALSRATPTKTGGYNRAEAAAPSGSTYNTNKHGTQARMHQDTGTGAGGGPNTDLITWKKRSVNVGKAVGGVFGSKAGAMARGATMTVGRIATSAKATGKKMIAKAKELYGNAKATAVRGFNKAKDWITNLWGSAKKTLAKAGKAVAGKARDAQIAFENATGISERNAERDYHSRLAGSRKNTAKVRKKNTMKKYGGSFDGTSGSDARAEKSSVREYNAKAARLNDPKNKRNAALRSGRTSRVN